MVLVRLRDGVQERIKHFLPHQLGQFGRNWFFRELEKILQLAINSKVEKTHII